MTVFVKNTKSFRCQRGFTLIEMAIVLVIISLLVAGVMQGQSLIRAARVNDVISIVNDLRFSVNAFKDRYKVLPGDHPTASAEIPGVTANGNGNGLITNFGNPDEWDLVPDHLFNAGYIKGGTGTIRTSYGQAWIVARTVAVGGGSPCGTGVDNTAPVPVVNNMIVFSDIPGDAAEEIDAKFDDGVFNTGAARASDSYATDTVRCLALPL